MRETDGCSTQAIRTTLRSRLEEKIRWNKQQIEQCEIEVSNAEKALQSLNKNKELETFVNLLNL